MEYDVDKITKNIKKKKFFQNNIKKIIICIIIVLFVISLIFITSSENGSKANSVFGLYGFVVVSGSMKPTINENDIVIVKKYAIEEIELNDIITFNYEDKIITHRVVYKDENAVYTKGDDNDTIDWYTIEENEIFGKVICIIPKVGFLIRCLHNENNYLKLIIIIFMIFVFITIKNNEKNKRKIKRKKFEIKRKREDYNN